MDLDRHVLRTALVLTLAAMSVAGCELLFPGFSPDGGFPSPSTIATYSHGSARIKIDGKVIELDKLGPGPHLQTMFGSSVRWSNADGWNLQVIGAGADFGQAFPSGLDESTGYVELDRIVGKEHWRTYDPERCLMTIDGADATALRGTATCRGLEWTDALNAFAASPKEIDQPPFDADITFEATR